MSRALAPHRPFAAALGVSILFHLSMISVFSIVIYFPREDFPYPSLAIVRQPSQPKSERISDPLLRTARRDLLRIAPPDELLESGDAGNLEMGARDVVRELPPPIELPRLQFADLERLHSRVEGLRIRSEFGGLLEPKGVDSWARFNRELKGISAALTRWGFPEPADARSRPNPIGNPAPGFAMFIQWMSEPKDRKVLFSPPIRALWSIAPAQLDEPIALIFTVNPEGKVTEVQIPIEDEAGVVADIGKSLIKFRFEALDVEKAKNQKGTLLVKAAEAAQASE
jgi:hypothetical protein